MTVVGCDNGSTNGENDTWSNVTNFSQVNGTWKAPPSYSASNQGITANVTTNNYLITFNSTAKTMSVSGSTTTIYSGANINSLWPDIKESMGYMNELDGVTVSTNDTNHSITLTYNNFSQVMTDSELSQVGIQINQNGSKLKMSNGGINIIYTKQ
jgi:histidinol phosphatase-like PHP family hydrolase